jgi:hypothetical protein
MLQNTGKVCGGHYRDSYALRSSPFVCIVDTTMMLVKLVWMLCVGCSFRTAARHVWYDRFERESPVFDNTWDILKAKFKSSGNSSVPADPSTNAVRVRISSQDNTPAGIGRKDTPTTLPHKRVVGVPSRDMGITRAQSESSSLTLVERPSVALVMQRNANDPFTRGNYSSVQASNVEAGPTSHGSSLQLYKHSGPYEGSAIDRTWRLSMASFIFGALPQAIKVFGMKGVPLTQALVAFLLVSFLVPEIIRMIAGTAGAFDLRPKLVVLKAKSTFDNVELHALRISIVFACYMFSYSVFIPMFSTAAKHSSNLVSWIHEFLKFFTLITAVSLNLVLLFSDSRCASWATRKIVLYSTLVLPQGVRDFYVKMRSSFAVGVSVVLAFDPPLSPACFESTVVCFFLTALQTLCLVVVFYSYTPIGKPPLPKMTLRNITLYNIYSAVHYSFFLFPLFYTISHLFYRLIFMGSLSRYPRQLFGLHGTVSEFWAGAFVLLNFVSSLVGFSVFWYEYGDFNDTYKPSWADALG